MEIPPEIRGRIKCDHGTTAESVSMQLFQTKWRGLGALDLPRHSLDCLRQLKSVVF
jgi:hypothetical protein